MKPAKAITLSVIGIALALLLAAPRTALLQGAVRTPWTAVGSTGTIDPISPPVAVDAESGFGYRTNSVRPIVIRYNVVNTAETGPNPSKPPWTQLEMGASAPPGSSVRATLFRVTPCTGAIKAIGRVSIAGSTASVCAKGTLTEGIDFHNFLYHVRVDLRRTTPNAKPVIRTLRIHP